MLYITECSTTQNGISICKTELQVFKSMNIIMDQSQNIDIPEHASKNWKMSAWMLWEIDRKSCLSRLAWAKQMCPLGKSWWIFTILTTKVQKKGSILKIRMTKPLIFHCSMYLVQAGTPWHGVYSLRSKLDARCSCMALYTKNLTRNNLYLGPGYKFPFLSRHLPH